MDEPALLQAEGLCKGYPGRGGRNAPLMAVHEVSVALAAGEVVAVVGRSGSGKSTLARLLAGLERPDAGDVRIDGASLGRAGPRQLRRLRRTVQLVLQEPRAALDPILPVGPAVAEPLLVHRLSPRGGRRDRVRELLELVGLAPTDELLSRLPHELSGGEAQRVLLARALACEPRGLLLDEPVSALDAPLRRRIVSELLALRDRLGLALLLIAHDLRLVRDVAGRMLVMDAGRVVEEGPAVSIMARPASAPARALVAAAGLATAARRREPGEGLGR
ncbi:MAG TPA: dipeptide/oligopeptide/nickel ABC transporter ATP-binding protein [Thermoanaerobaculaceae bacterium]|nr:dipeptide/oligopeptide/nickel ABC transporter ATP-binding protein [Thermoanaerobaculaceae bacterium]HRS16767.1 dipeptide/oligopeptide/nickel ABC transporter ATP-binding protein [Thermoanaerobaculaceae bacterium]